MSDGGAEPGGSPVLLAEPGDAGRAREKLPSRAELENALRAGGGSGGTGGGFKDIPGTSAVSPGSSKQRAPDTESPSGTGEADYCRRILVRDAKGTIREIVLPKGLDLDRPKRTRTSFTAEQLYRLELEFQRCQSRCGSRTAARSRRKTRAGTLTNAPPAPPPSPWPPATSCGCWSKAACCPLRASCPLLSPPTPSPALRGAAELWPGRAPRPRPRAAPRPRRFSACTSRPCRPLPPRRPRRRRGCRGGRCVSGPRCWAACTTCPAFPPSSLTRGWRGRTVLYPARSRALKNRTPNRPTPPQKNTEKRQEVSPPPAATPLQGRIVPVDVTRAELVVTLSGSGCGRGRGQQQPRGQPGGGGCRGCHERGQREVAPGCVPAVSSEKRRAWVSPLAPRGVSRLR